MASKSNPLYCSTLLALLALAASVGRVFATSHFKIAVASTPVPYDAVDPNQVGGRSPRYLRAFAIEDDDDLEERGLDGLKTVLKKLTPDKQEQADKLFTRLKLSESKSNLFGNPKFQKWMSSVEKSYKKTPEAADAAMVLTMKTQFGDDGLAKLLLHAKGSPESRELATRLEGVQFKNWIESKQTATDAFKLLKLDQDAGMILKNPLVTTWMSYVELRKGNPIDEMLRQLKTRYSDGALARMFASAKLDSSTSAIAGKLEEALVGGWIRQRKSADYMFLLLRLNEEGDDLLKSPVWNTWVSYVTKQHKSPYKSMLSVIKTHYSELDISRMLTAAKRSESTRDAATRLEKVRLEREVVDGGKTAAEAFRGFKFDKFGERVFKNRGFVALARRYSTEDMLRVLQTHYTDVRLAKMLDMAKQAPNSKKLAISLELGLWQSQRKSADEVFKLLKLEKTGDSFLHDPYFGLWFLYTMKLAQVDKKSGKFAAISVLEQRFGDLELAMVLSAAKGDDALMAGSNGQTIGQLQKLQFKEWIVKRVTPASVADRVTNKHDARASKVASEYGDFYEAFHAKFKTPLDPINERV